MRGFWSETNWRLDGDTLLMPNGQRLPLKHILHWRQDLLDGNADLTGKWSGWRVRQQWLIPPGGSMRRGRIAQHVLAHDIRPPCCACPREERRREAHVELVTDLHMVALALAALTKRTGTAR